MAFSVRIHIPQGTICFEAEENARLMDILTNAGTPVNAPCGGRGFCGKCRVIVRGHLSEMTPEEARFFTKDEIRAGYRLACAARILGEAEITIPEEAGAVIVTESHGGTIALDSGYSLFPVRVPAPSLSDQRGDDERLLAALGFANGITLSAARALPSAVRAETTWALLRDGNVLAVSDAPLSALGVAVDIGTTTIVAYLLDLLTGERLATSSRLNPQRQFGADVISRADHARTSENSLFEEAECVRRTLCEMVREMLQKENLPEEAVYEYALAGNTIMMHLFAGISPEHIAVTPFIPAYTGGMTVSAKEVGLIPQDARVSLLPCVAGYVGADTVAAMLACDMDEAEGVSLLLDIGTNGEIALGGRDGILCCSAAAGPAFEGAHIHCGTGAIEGAIDHVRVDGGKISYTTIAGVEPIGICGSGLVDAIAQLLDAYVIDETGRIDEDEAPEEMLCDFEGKCAVKIAESIVLTQKDVREVQLAKGAIAAGIEILMREMGVTDMDIRKVFLAGGFGSFIQKESACRIGLIPASLLSKIEPVGNAAGAGAQRHVLNRSAASRMENLRKKATYLELSAIRSFQELFAEKMLFE
ncbi:MAG: ASKHA domain-containing protein [Christensenellales bacterium]|jgi:uncharacterized 2Fe-2S/4Fe-4S cluster protein (DUF4445 family)